MTTLRSIPIHSLVAILLIVFQIFILHAPMMFTLVLYGALLFIRHLLLPDLLVVQSVPLVARHEDFSLHLNQLFLHLTRLPLLYFL